MLASDSALLERAFDVLNQIYFEDGLPDVVITIQSSPGCYGYITTHKVWSDATQNYYEINIGAEYLSRPIENVLATLMHEMVHLYCMVNGIKDTSNGARYHNKQFKTEAERRDLKIGYAQYVGYSITEPTDKFFEVISENGLYEGISHYRASGSVGDAPPNQGGGNDSEGASKGKRKTSTRKYICTSCGMSVRATKDVNIICGDCRGTMVKAD